MTIALSSSAALATLTVSQARLDNDPVLALLVKQLASPLQVKLDIIKKKGNNDLALKLLDESTTLTERNVILRALAGPVLHHALDTAYGLLGGHSSTRQLPQSAMALSSLGYWMAVASSSQISDDVTSRVEMWLSNNSFLIPTAQPTLADMDLCMAMLLKTNNDNDTDFGPNTKRWMETVHSYMTELVSGNPAVKLPSLPSEEEQPVVMTSGPIFFYGDEEFQPVKPPAPVAKAPGGGKKKGGGQQQQQQKKKGGGGAEGNKKGAAAAAGKKQQQAQPVDISALDLRVGKIIKAWHHPEAEKLFCEEVDVGEDEPRQIASGLRPFYKTEDLMGRRCMVLCNLKVRKMMGFPSHGMVMCASNADHSSVEFIVPPEDAKIGERIEFEGIEMKAPEPESKVNKKKMFETLAPDLKTNENGEVVWKTFPAKTTAGPMKAFNGMAHAQVA